MSSQLFLLVLAGVCVCQALNTTNVEKNITSEASTTLAPDIPNTSTLLTPFPQKHTSSNQTLTAQTLTATRGGNITTSNYNDDNDQKTTIQAEDNPEVSTMAPSGSTDAASDESSHASWWGYLLLVLLLLVILTMLVILYLLRRASRTYSFDLRRVAPVNHTDEPSGTFGVICLDEQDQMTPKDRETASDPSVSPAANGSAPQSQETAPEPNINHLKDSNVRDSNSTIPDEPIEMAASHGLLQDTSEKDNMSPVTSTDTLAGMELTESLPIKHITPPGSSSSSSY